MASDGAIDWLPLPDLDSPSVFAAILDCERGGQCLLQPEVPYEVRRRYLPDTNVLETTFLTGAGSVRVLDAMTRPGLGVEPVRELQRRVEGLSGSVPMRWSVEPRLDYGRRPAQLGWRYGFPVATAGCMALAVCSFGAGEAEESGGGFRGHFQTSEGSSGVLALCASHQEPLVFPRRSELDHRLEATCRAWAQWASERAYEGPWRDAVIRSALALKLLVYAPSGAIAAAATTSLPEEIGGSRNWDYRYSWIRDSAFAVDSFVSLGCSQEATAYFWWLMHASQLTRPRLHVLYRLDGSVGTDEEELPLAGYRNSRPVRLGNGAASQLQLDTYGELLQTAWLYAEAGNGIDRDIGKRLAEIADHVCEVWRHPDAGIWEVRSDPLHFTQSKMMCCIALDRATKLAKRQLLPSGNVARWQQEADAVRSFVEERCFSERVGAYVRAVGSEDLDASVLLGVLHDYRPATDQSMQRTVEAICRHLKRGPYLFRYSGEDGLPGSEGAFVACSFWLCAALARCGRREEAADLMDELVASANDVGLFAEEIDPASGDFLGNMPQALSHLALIRAAVAIAQGESG